MYNSKNHLSWRFRQKEGQRIEQLKHCDEENKIQAN